MKIEAKSALILLATLLLGVVLGGLATGAAARLRMEHLMRLGRPPGFTAHMHDVIRPSSDAQWDSLRPLVEITARRNAELRRRTGDAMRAELDSLQLRLRPLLDPAQRARLQEFARRPPPPPPGGGPPREDGAGGPPPPREGPPPPP